MSISIALTTNFLRREAGFEDYEVPSEVKTISDLLQYLGKRTTFRFTDQDGARLRPDIEVTLNGKDLAFFPDRLQTPLKEGDCLDINLTPLGGG